MSELGEKVSKSIKRLKAFEPLEGQATIRKYGEVVPCKDSFQCLRDKSGS